MEPSCIQVVFLTQQIAGGGSQWRVHSPHFLFVGTWMVIIYKKGARLDGSLVTSSRALLMSVSRLLASPKIGGAMTTPKRVCNCIYSSRISMLLEKFDLNQWWIVPRGHFMREHLASVKFAHAKFCRNSLLLEEAGHIQIIAGFPPTKRSWMKLPARCRSCRIV